MVTVRELKDWLEQLDDAQNVGIDEGGLTLIVPGSEAYYEIGGVPAPGEDALREAESFRKAGRNALDAAKALRQDYGHSDYGPALRNVYSLGSSELAKVLFSENGGGECLEFVASVLVSERCFTHGEVAAALKDLGQPRSEVEYAMASTDGGDLPEGAVRIALGEVFGAEGVGVASEGEESAKRFVEKMDRMAAGANRATIPFLMFTESKVATLVEMPKNASGDYYGQVQTAFRKQAGIRGDSISEGFTHMVALHPPRKTSQGLFYDEQLASINGMAFTLFAHPGTSPDVINKAKAEIRRDRDVVSLRVVRFKKVIDFALPPPVQENLETIDAPGETPETESGGQRV